MILQGRGTWAAVLLALASLACGPGQPATSEIVVSAAISLKGPLEEVARLYQERYQDFSARLNFGASGLLSSQIEQGAPVDVFASASDELLDELERQGLLLAGTRRLLAGNKLVAIVPRESKASFDHFSGLGSLASLALGNPRTVPAGAYAEQCLTSLGLWGRLEPRLIFAENARQVVDYVARGEVEAGVVYATDAALLPSRVQVAARAPENCHPPIRYGITVVASSRKPFASRAFIELATGPEARRAFSSRGFLPPDL